MQITYLTILIILKKGNQQQNALGFFSFQKKVYPGYKRFSSRVRRYTSVSWAEAKPLAPSGSLYTLGTEIGNRACLRSSRLEVVGARDGETYEGRQSTPLACLPLARSVFLAPTTSKRLPRRLKPLMKSLWYPGLQKSNCHVQTN